MPNRTARLIVGLACLLSCHCRGVPARSPEAGAPQRATAALSAGATSEENPIPCDTQEVCSSVAELNVELAADLQVGDAVEKLTSHLGDSVVERATHRLGGAASCILYFRIGECITVRAFASWERGVLTDVPLAAPYVPWVYEAGGRLYGTPGGLGFATASCTARDGGFSTYCDRLAVHYEVARLNQYFVDGKHVGRLRTEFEDEFSGRFSWYSESLPDVPRPFLAEYFFGDCISVSFALSEDRKLITGRPYARAASPFPSSPVNYAADADEVRCAEVVARLARPGVALSVLREELGDCVLAHDEEILGGTGAASHALSLRAGAGTEIVLVLRVGLDGIISFVPGLVAPPPTD